MKTPARIVLIRHAESERNKALDGALFLNDPSLFESVGKIPDHKISITDKGQKQAHETSTYLTQEVGIPDVVFHSGYMRTKQTTEGVLSEYKEKINIKENLGLREREGGYTHTLLEADKEKYFPFLQEYWDIVGGVFARPVGGESLIDVMEKRLRPFLEYLHKEYAGKTVFVITHGRVIQCFRFILDEMTWQEMEDFLNSEGSLPHNCGITIYSHDAQTDKLKLDTWNKVYWK